MKISEYKANLVRQIKTILEEELVGTNPEIDDMVVVGSHVIQFRVTSRVAMPRWFTLKLMDGIV